MKSLITLSCQYGVLPILTTGSPFRYWRIDHFDRGKISVRSSSVSSLSIVLFCLTE